MVLDVNQRLLFFNDLVLLCVRHLHLLRGSKLRLAVTTLAASLLLDPLFDSHVLGDWVLECLETVVGDYVFLRNFRVGGRVFGEGGLLASLAHVGALATGLMLVVAIDGLVICFMVVILRVMVPNLSSEHELLLDRLRPLINGRQRVALRNIVGRYSNLKASAMPRHNKCSCVPEILKIFDHKLLSPFLCVKQLHVVPVCSLCLHAVPNH